MMFILDTNAVSELRKVQFGKANARFVQWADNTSPSDLYVSAITIMEIEIGALQMERRDAVQGAALRRWLENQVLPSFEERILPVDLDVARRCANLHVPDRKNERDALIAATALVHKMTVVSRNVADFASTGVALVNPWDHAS
ncbi:type II toxin-antitoxin system VapC family toxin [Taklimakanibacter lacteus]|uniref:type II toxin-antitoxin system VapC family toxin n=1 Tax=Taklimakanibacter lacteus TaxID=2268456 RepID=UPI0034D7880E